MSLPSVILVRKDRHQQQVHQHVPVRRENIGMDRTASNVPQELSAILEPQNVSLVNMEELKHKLAVSVVMVWSGSGEITAQDPVGLVFLTLIKQEICPTVLPAQLDPHHQLELNTVSVLLESSGMVKDVIHVTLDQLAMRVHFNAQIVHQVCLLMKKRHNACVKED